MFPLLSQYSEAGGSEAKGLKGAESYSQIFIYGHEIFCSIGTASFKVMIV